MTPMPASPFLSSAPASTSPVAVEAAVSIPCQGADAAAEILNPRDKFRRAVAEVLTDWRIGCIATRPNGAEVMIFREGVADIIRFRLRIAYMPLFQGLERIERRVGILAELKREPWAAATHRVNLH